MKIVFFEVAKKEEQFFKDNLPNDEVICLEEKLNEQNINMAKEADIVSLFVESEMSKNVIDGVPNLKFIATRTTGYDAIDFKYARTKNIGVANVPVYGSSTVAEFTFALLLNLSRKICEAKNQVSINNDFKKEEFLQGFDLEGKILGVIGAGKIGKNVIRIAKAFNMKVLAYDLYPDVNFAKENDFEYVNFLEVLAKSDIITLHTPYTKENYHLINKENIFLMKKGVYIINTARGELIDTKALISGIKKGIIAGAGLDVLEGERQFKKGVAIPILNMQNVIVTPHIAFYSKEAKLRIINTTIENIKAFISGNPINLVN